MILEPRIGRDFAGPLAIIVVQLDLHIVRQLTLLIILGPDAQEFGGWDGQTLRLKRKADRALLDHAVDVMPPRVAIEQADDVELRLLAESLEQASHPARRLAAAVSENAIVLFPESIFVEAVPDGSLFDMQHKVRVDLLELNDVAFGNARNRISPRSHPPAINLLSLVHNRDISHHRPAILGENMQFLAKTAHGNFKVLKNSVRLALIVKRLFLRPRHRMQAFIKHASKAQCLLGL